ncbi:MAG: EFR1 family ferrodoxin [Syntrophaceae bacterium]|nr:EFR1 family ferrodoxin [Syntrophaceae bacterium]
MNTDIYFFTGTGNSFWIAKKLSEKLENANLISIASLDQESIHTSSEVVGLVFPVHIWGVPKLIIDFVNRLDTNSARYYFALAVNAGQVAATLIQLKKLFLTKGLNLDSGFSIDMPSNYIPWGGAIAEGKQQIKFNTALEKVNHVAKCVKARKIMPPEKGPFWQNILFSFFYRKSFPHIEKMDKSFWADDNCTSCRICEKICPVQNIVMKDGKPAWQNRCEQCFACLQWCPEEAIQHSKNTKKKKRYHHPDISINDMLNCASHK